MDHIEKLGREMPYKWRVQSFSTYKEEATLVAYIDARQASDILNDVFGLAWSCEYRTVEGKLFCRISVKIDDSYYYREDCGTESTMEKEKGEASDAFKRAAVKFGVGRFLYDLDPKKVRTSAKHERGKPNPFLLDNNGNRIYNVSNLSPRITAATLKSIGDVAKAQELKDVRSFALKHFFFKDVRELSDEQGKRLYSLIMAYKPEKKD